MRARVLTSERELPADAVIFGGDHRTLADLPQRRPARRTGGAPAPRAPAWPQRASHTIRLRRGAPLAVSPPSRAGAHEIRFCADYDVEFDDIYRHGRLPRDPTLYVSIPTVTERAAGAGAGDPERWFVLVNAPAGLG